MLFIASILLSSSSWLMSQFAGGILHLEIFQLNSLMPRRHRPKSYIQHVLIVQPSQMLLLSSHISRATACTQ
jgi:hypothetical protein